MNLRRPSLDRGLYSPRLGITVGRIEGNPLLSTQCGRYIHRHERGFAVAMGEMGSVSAESSTRLQSVADRMLVQRAVQNDAEAFGELIRRYSSLMRAYVYRIVGSLTDTDDVVQNALVIAWKQLPTLCDASAVKAWLMRIAGREALSFVSRRPVEAVLDDYAFPAPQNTQPEQTAIRNAQLSALSRALDRLKVDQRRSWLLREVAACSYDEIAELMDIPPSTVRGLLSRARASIAIEMEGWR